MKQLESNRSLITHVPSAESISRKRTYTIEQLREDGRDVQSQFIVLLSQLAAQSFTGSLQINLYEGAIRNVETIEKQKL